MPRRTLLVLLAVGCAVLVVGGIAIWIVGTSRTTAEPPQIASTETPTTEASPSEAPSPAPTPTVPPSPTTAPDAGGEPEDSFAPQTPEPAPPLAAGTVSVTLSFVTASSSTGTVEAGGYADALDEGGVCTLVLTHAGETVRAERPALPDASTTSCGGFSIPLTGMAPGSWSAVLEFVSPTGDGRSDPTQVEIP